MASPKSISKLKLFRYSPTGSLLPFLIVFAGIGAYVLTSSHAATVSYVNFLNSGSAAQTAGVSTVTDNLLQIGAQSVSQVAPGGQLDYLTGGKVAYGSICYYARAVNPKGVGTTAKVEFVGQGSSKTVSLPVANDYQSVCVNSGHGALKAYNVYNLSPADGPNVLIYQAVLNF